MTALARRLAPVLIAAALPMVLAGCVGPTGPATSSSSSSSSSSSASSSSASPANEEPFDVVGKVSTPIHGEHHDADHGSGDEHDDAAPKTGEKCEASDDFSDIEEGGEVVLTGSTGKVTGTLGAGRARANSKEPELGRCEFGFTIKNVPPGGRSYQLGVGDPSRGTLPFTQKELEDGPTVTVG